MGALEGLDLCELVWAALVADAGAGGVNTLLGGTPTTPGRIYRDRVPAAALLPAATVGLVADVETRTLGGRRVKSTTDVDVRVIGDGSAYGAIAPIAERIDDVLQERGGVSDRTYVAKLSRTDKRAFPEDDAGRSYTHVIQTYRADTAPSP